MKLPPAPSRLRVSPELLASVATRLTERDRHLCRTLWDHRVLTTNHIADLAFDSVRAAEHRLLTLYRLRVLTRFQPAQPAGSAPYHYVLDQLGAWVAAADRGEDPASLRYRPERALAVAHSQRLAHLVGVNGLFASLIGHARRCADHAELLRWWPETRCAAAWGQTVRPDGYGRWREQGRHIDFFVEYDRGTERPATRLTERLSAYAELADATGITTPVLIWTTTPRRETAVRRHLTTPPVPTATAHPIPGRSPAEDVWLPAQRGTVQRVRLIDLR